NGNVDALELSGNTLYLGGDFTVVGPHTGAFVPLDPASGKPIHPFPTVIGSIRAMAPDGDGGWFIGGGFTSVGWLPRRNLAHVLADGSVVPWNPSAEGIIVLALAVSGNTVYVGGCINH